MLSPHALRLVIAYWRPKLMWKAEDYARKQVVWVVHPRPVHAIVLTAFEHVAAGVTNSDVRGTRPTSKGARAGKPRRRWVA